MSYVIDTNIISEVRKGSRCDANVAAWYSAIDDSELYLSTLVIGEIRKGIERARPRDAEKAEALERWLGEVTAAFDGRILLIDNAVSEEWGRMCAVRSIPVIEGLLAATAKANHMTLVTRHDADVDGLGAKLLNPFKPMNSAP